MVLIVDMIYEHWYNDLIHKLIISQRELTTKMGIFNIKKPQKVRLVNEKSIQADPSGPIDPLTGKPRYADSHSIAEDERPYYRNDEYYTLYSYPETEMARRVITYEERKKLSNPTKSGLYVADILLLEYSDCNYPKPNGGYAGFWWFEYGVRDIGHTLESLERRGFLKWAPVGQCLTTMKVEELKSILGGKGLATTGKKADLIKRITMEIPDGELCLPDSAKKYALTEQGKEELLQNGYIPYMHNHPHKTIEGSMFGTEFNVWSVNKLFPDGDASNWREVVGGIEEKLFGVNTAYVYQDSCTRVKQKQERRDYAAEQKDVRAYLAEQKSYIDNSIRTSGNGFTEESMGLDLKRIGRDKEALVQFYIAIGKNFDAPALYRESAELLVKYEMFDEALYVIDRGMKNIPENNWHRKELQEYREKIIQKLDKGIK